MTKLHSHRRGFLQQAAACGLAFTLPAMEARAAARRGEERPKSLLVLWLDGGPSQLETWDPHPGSSIGGPTRAIKTSLPGVNIAEHYQRLAEQLHQLSVIRSLVSKEGDHERASYLMKTGYPPDPTLQHPAVGAIVSRESPNPRLEVPPFISLGFDPHPARGGFLGREFDAFQLYDPGETPQNLTPHVGDGRRQERRLQNLDVVSRAFARGRESATQKTLHRQSLDGALKMMSSEQLGAFSIADEPAAVRTAYGDSTFGRGCLVARRLIELGVRCVQVSLLSFDSHEQNFSKHRENAAILDPAFSTLLRDLRERDLFQSTVVLCTGEFGRTPRINARDGRDHWPGGFSCLLGGGGLRGGVLIGATDPAGRKRTPDDPIEVPDLYATVLHALGVEYAREVLTPIGRPVKYSSGAPIARLTG
jgi:hypothetical protein